MFRKNNTNYYIGMTRFDPNTWTENTKFRAENSIDGCIYASPRSPSMCIPIDSVIFVLEMLNINKKKDIDYPGKILGIGIIRNRPKPYTFPVYEDRNYNRYLYAGNYRFDRQEADAIQEVMFLKLDEVCFKGKTHLKRGQGITLFPQRLLQLEMFHPLAEMCTQLLYHYQRTTRDVLQEKEDEDDKEDGD
jgi:hypothetical protein